MAATLAVVPIGPSVGPASASGPIVTSISPPSGTVAGGTDLTISGTGFGSDSATVSVTVGGVPAIIKTFAPPHTSIVVTLPVRATNDKTVGAQEVVVSVGGVSSNSDKTYTYRPVLGAVGTSRVWLHDLASRSQRKTIARTQTAPFLVSGIDSRTGESYLYETDVLFNTASAAYSRESDERNSSFTATSVTSGNFGGFTVGSGPTNLTALKSGGSCSSENGGRANLGDSNDGEGSVTTYCSIFGPEVYTESFYGRAGQSLSFEWRAKNVSDDYEIYAFLVRVDDDSPVSYGAGNALIAATGAGTGRNAPDRAAHVDRHTLVTHSLGRAPSAFATSSAAIPADGLYRFRFVNGSYDATGGFVWGAEMYIKNTILVGTTNSITVNAGNPLSDQVGSGSPVSYSPYTFNATATSGAEVFVASTGKCTVSSAGSNPTVVTVNNSGGAGDCTLRFTQGASGEFAPAEDVTRKFAWLSAATAPQAPTITGVVAANQSLSVSFLPPAGDGGSSIFNYEFSTDNGSTWTAVSPESTNSPVSISSLTNGTTYTVRIRAVNSVGAGTQSGSSTGTPNASAPGAPTSLNLSAGDGQLSVSFVAPSNDGGSPISNYEYSIDNGVNWVTRTPPSTLTSFIIPSLTNGLAYPVRVRAVNLSGSGAQSGSSTGTPALPPPPAPPAAVAQPVAPPVVTPVTPPTIRPPQQVTLPIQPSIQSGPVLRNNVVSPPPVAPTGSINGVPTNVSTLVTDPTQLNLRTGVLNIAVNVNPQQGLVRQGTGGETEVQVRSGGTTSFTGSGLAPRSTVQVFMPLQGGDAKELARIPVDAAGSFSGDAVFAASLQDAPIPVGRQTLQMVTLDEQGRQAVVEFTVNIAQPPPAPERNRQAGTTPQLLPGQSLATNAGIPETVQVTALPDQKQTIIEGDGWSMAVDVNNPDATVEEGADGSVTLKLVRDESARVSGSGFMPFTRADVWLFSEPTLLGTVDIDENGEFNGLVNVDGNVVSVGEHTLQLQGIGQDGYVRAANLGVIVGDEQAIATEEQAQSLLWLLWVLLAALVAIVGGYLYWRQRRQRHTT